MNVSRHEGERGGVWNTVVGNAKNVWNGITKGSQDLGNAVKSGDTKKAAQGVKKEMNGIENLEATSVNETKAVAKEEASRISSSASADLTKDVEGLVKERNAEVAKAEKEGLTASQVAADIMAKQIICATKNTEKVQ